MLKTMLAAAVALSAALGATDASAQLCARWSAPAQQVGELDTSLINEASGVAISRAHPGRLYFNNDSGDGPFFYVTDAAGAGTRKITIIGGFAPQDVEDIALGPCGAGRTCLVLGDIGDNANRRPQVTFVLMAEQATFPDSVAPLRTVNARYPEGPQDAESFAIHPNGDLYVITKPRDIIERRAGVARVYRLRAAQLAVTDGSVQVFEQVGTIDFPFLLYFNGLAGQIATGMDFAPDGSRALVITYQSAVEINFDFSRGFPASRSWRPNVDYRSVQLVPLPQAEAIAYGPDGRSFVYTSERVDAQYVAMAPLPVDTQGHAPLYRQTCEQVAPPAAAPAAAPAPTAPTAPAPQPGGR